MNESYRATLILVGIVFVLSVSSWRLIQLETPRVREQTPVSMVEQPQSHPQEETEVTKPPAPHAPTPDRAKELLAAALRGDTRAVLALVNKGVDINTANTEGLTPLLALIKKGNPSQELIEKLLDAGADASAKDRSGSNALAIAAANDDVGTIATLLKNRPQLAEEAAGALCEAAAKSHVEALTTLLDGHADVNKPDKSGRTALAVAVKQGDGDTVRFLLDNGADANRKNSDGLTPLMLAVTRGDKDLVQAVAEKSSNVDERNSKGETALMQAVRTGNIELARPLIDARADINAADFQSTTPLMAAASAGHSDLVQLLLDKGANPDAKDTQEETALSLARKNNHSDIVDLLSKSNTSD